MNYEKLKEEVEQKAKAAEFTKTGKCPRCGRDMSKHPALSRFANVDVCSDCGLDEALLCFAQLEDKAKGLQRWAVLKEDMSEANDISTEIICTHNGEVIMAKIGLAEMLRIFRSIKYAQLAEDARSTAYDIICGEEGITDCYKWDGKMPPMGTPTDKSISVRDKWRDITWAVQNIEHELANNEEYADIYWSTIRAVLENIAEEGDGNA